MRHHYQNWKFRSTKLRSEYIYENYLQEKREESLLIAMVEESGELYLYPLPESKTPKAGDTVISYGPEIKDSRKVEVENSA